MRFTLSVSFFQNRILCVSEILITSNYRKMPLTARNKRAANALVSLSRHSHETPMTLRIKTLTGQTYTLTNVLPSDTVETLYQKFAEQAPGPRRSLRLIFDGKQLPYENSTHTVSSYGIQDGSQLHLVLAIRGDGGGRRKTRRSRNSRRNRKH